MLIVDALNNSMATMNRRIPPAIIKLQDYFYFSFDAHMYGKLHLDPRAEIKEDYHYEMMVDLLALALGTN